MIKNIFHNTETKKKSNNHHRETKRTNTIFPPNHERKGKQKCPCSIIILCWVACIGRLPSNALGPPLFRIAWKAGEGVPRHYRLLRSSMGSHCTPFRPAFARGMRGRARLLRLLPNQGRSPINDTQVGFVMGCARKTIDFVTPKTRACDVHGKGGPCISSREEKYRWK